MPRRDEEEKFIDIGAAMRGSLVFSDPVNLEISGKFEGDLTLKGNLIIGKDAEVRADIVGEDIVIAGSIKGKIKATQRLKLTSTAKVTADIEAPKVCIEEGAIFNGKFHMPQQNSLSSQSHEYFSVEDKKIEEWISK
ncbi:MAG: polymer-forming cytoskeletal protein [Omnitrophica bacterium]|nr:polymer-forming cytoskeletal protein [Candidatus Omnitrophota bacterium]